MAFIQHLNPSQKNGLPQRGDSECIQNRNFVITVLQHIKPFLLVPQ